MTDTLDNSQRREKCWQETAGRMAVIANFMYHLVDERTLSENDLDMVHKMYAEILEMIEFDEEIE